jgi:HEAT repeat protein
MVPIRKIGLHFGILIWIAANITAFADPVSDLRQSLTSADPTVRADAIQKFVISLGTVNGEKLMVPSVPILIDALSDSDSKVRLSAISGLRGVLFFHSPLIYRTLPANQNPSTLPTLEPALLKATSDPDPETRQLALEAYAITYKLTPELEDKVIAEFQSPDSELPHHESQRPALMESLMLNRDASPHAVDFLTKLLDDPRWAPHVANAMASDNCPLPDSVLPKLATLLAQDKDTVHRAAYARAIGSYGKRAQFYRPQLEAALASEPDDVTKQNIQFALKRIQ